MVTQTLIDYLKDENVDINKKYLYIKRLNLQYSDLFELQEIFSHDSKIYMLLRSFTYYRDSKFYNKITSENRKREKINKKKMKRTKK